MSRVHNKMADEGLTEKPISRQNMQTFFCNFFSDLEGKPVKFCGMGLNMVKCVKRS